MAGRLQHYGAALLLVHLLSGCAPSSDRQAQNSTPDSAPVTAPVATAQAADARLIVVFGDSLYAGYNLGPEEGFAPALQRQLSAGGHKLRVFNAGVSGDTSAAGRQRLGFVLDGLPRKPDLVLVGLGGNDMLRGLSPAATRENLDAILSELKARDIPAMLTGILASPNMGPDYAAAFNPIYPDLAKSHGVPLYPFFLDGVIGNRALLLPDGIHPNAKGIDIIVKKIAPQVAETLPADG